MELMHIYIENGRFGEFVAEIIDMENKRRKEETEKEDDNKLWLAYILSMSNKPFSEWKNELCDKKEHASYEMTEEQVESVKHNARGILSRFSPK